MEIVGDTEGEAVVDPDPEQQANPEIPPPPMPRVKAKGGFGAMSAEKQREIASLGGKAAHKKGTAHEFTPESARIAGQKGGIAAHAKQLPSKSKG